MSLNFLDFEQPIAELEAKIDSLTAVSRQDERLDINIDEEVHRLREKSVELTRKIFAILVHGRLRSWRAIHVARTPWIMSAWLSTNSTNWPVTVPMLTIKLSSAGLRVWTGVR